MNAAEDLSVGFHVVPRYQQLQCATDLRQRLDRAFEAIECVMRLGTPPLKRLVIFILSNFA